MPVVQMASEETPPPGKDNTKDKLVSMQPTVHKKTIGAQFSAVVGKNFKLKVSFFFCLPNSCKA